MAAVVSVVVLLAGLAVFVFLLRSVLSPVEHQLRRIADELAIRNTLDADEPLSADRT